MTRRDLKSECDENIFNSTKSRHEEKLVTLRDKVWTEWKCSYNLIYDAFDGVVKVQTPGTVL